MPSSNYKSKQVIVMRRDLKMRKGKIAAQSGHACVEATLMAIAREGRADQIRAEDGRVAIGEVGKVHQGGGADEGLNLLRGAHGSAS